MPPAAPPGGGSEAKAATRAKRFKCLKWTFKCIFWPVILLVQAIWIYFFGCIFIYVKRGSMYLFCGVCICCNCTYKDKSFPHNHQSLGALEGKTPEELDAEVTWRRIGDVVAAGSRVGAKLFSGRIEPSDICQGGLGDCWLLSSIACLANQDGAIQKVFLTDEYSRYGRYRLRLFDAETSKFKTVVIDDFIPCSKTGKPMFAQPHGDEAWVLLLEKAFAKFQGSYAALDGGLPLWGLRCLSGGTAFSFRRQGQDKWRCSQPAAGRGYGSVERDDEPLDPEGMFNTMLFYNRKKAFIAAATLGGSDTQNVDGIVQGHAYSVVNVKRVDRYQLVQLRNPWGSFEWKGDWSDASPLWEQNPKVKRAVDFVPSDDGTFWMSFADFAKYYNCLDFCTHTTGFDDLELDVHEEHPKCGPVLGCVLGCVRYWLCCLGVRALFFRNKATYFQAEAAKAQTGCCSAC